MEKFSFWSIAKQALNGHKGWTQQWGSPEPRKHYDVVIIGGGGQGLATAYYLAKKYGINNVAVLEKGWLGGGNTGRNTTMVRSNYFYPASSNFYDYSLQQYEQLSTELNYNVMLSQRGTLNLVHSEHELEIFGRWSNALQLQGIDNEFLTVDQVKEYAPLLNTDPSARYPIHGGFIQRRGGVARHDAVAWGYARAADALGVDIIQGCEVTAIHRSGNRITGVETPYGTIRTDKLAMCVAGCSSVVAAQVGLKLPIKSQSLQAMVSEPVKPILDGCIGSASVHCYVSQSDRGEILIGGSADLHPSYGQRGVLPCLEETLAATLELFPAFSRLKLMRQWAGIVDISPDSSPIIGKTPVTGFYISTGWGTGGFKGIPAGGDTLAYTIAHDKPHDLIEPFSLGRFARGEFVNEAAAAGIPH